MPVETDKLTGEFRMIGAIESASVLIATITAGREEVFWLTVTT